MQCRCGVSGCLVCASLASPAPRLPVPHLRRRRDGALPDHPRNDADEGPPAWVGDPHDRGVGGRASHPKSALSTTRRSSRRTGYESRSSLTDPVQVRAVGRAQRSAARTTGNGSRYRPARFAACHGRRSGTLIGSGQRAQSSKSRRSTWRSTLSRVPGTHRTQSLASSSAAGSSPTRACPVNQPARA